ncbi:MAG: bifunctional (p)ppGpp synthetase/guanosine-3',5'-bis(diphosphate) 3'-pyrophosphohydrolase, partial [Actinomycetes bacterium]
VSRSLREHHPKTDQRDLQLAFDIAEVSHRGQLRKSGEAYITHPVEVTEILADLGMPLPVLVAALLHDTVEDTSYSLAELRETFGDEVAELVDGVTKLDKLKYGNAAQAETVRKMVVAMARDIRVLVIKLADRLHNMRTLSVLNPDRQEAKAQETLEIYAPLAHRLGMNAIKWELEDLAFATLNPKMFDEIKELVDKRAPERDGYLSDVIAQVSHDLADQNIKATVTGRPKHLYSVYQKMIVRGRDFTDIYDLVGVRILVEDVRDCYGALGAIHARWNPVPGRFKDYIAMPKFNMYESLHTTVMGPAGKPVELQIRTYAMHRRAEYGIASHWKYKEDSTGRTTGIRDSGDMYWLKQLLDWQQETADPSEFLDGLRYDLSTAEVFVFTPKGEVLALPAGSTAVDMAYAVHTEVGHRCIGARVNGRLVPLESTLDNGDVVEIFTSKGEGAGPSLDWLNFVGSTRARNRIKAWFSKERREEAAEIGRDELAKALRKEGLPLRVMTGDDLATVAHALHCDDIHALFIAIGENRVSAGSVVAKLVTHMGGTQALAEDIADTDTSVAAMRFGRERGDSGVVVLGAGEVWSKLARCCTPVPGDEIVGFVTRGSGVSVHRTDCVNVEAMADQVDRFVEVQWAPTSQSMFLVNIQIEALDRSRLLSDVTRALSDQHVNILSASVSTSKDRIAMSRFTFEMADPKHLDHVLRAVRGVAGVFD